MVTMKERLESWGLIVDTDFLKQEKVGLTPDSVDAYLNSDETTRQALLMYASAEKWRMLQPLKWFWDYIINVETHPSLAGAITFMSMEGLEKPFKPFPQGQTLRSVVELSAARTIRENKELYEAYLESLVQPDSRTTSEELVYVKPTGKIDKNFPSFILKALYGNVGPEIVKAPHRLLEKAVYKDPLTMTEVWHFGCQDVEEPAGVSEQDSPEILEAFSSFSDHLTLAEAIAAARLI